MTEQTPAGRFRLSRIPGSYVNLRAADTTSSGIVARLHKGDVLTLTGRLSGDWLEATTADGVRGWVSRQGGKVTFAPVEAEPAPYRLGIDVSQAQTPIGWARVKAAGYSFAIIRATQGKSNSIPVGVDTRFVAHLEAALDAGMEVSTYHAYLGAVDGKAQADFYLGAIAPYLDKLAFPVAVDVEVSNDRSPALVAERLYALLTRLEDVLGYKALIYTAQGVWNQIVGTAYDDYFAQHGLWVANYTPAATPALPRCWNDWQIWQHSSKARVPGYSKNIDVNRMRVP